MLDGKGYLFKDVGSNPIIVMLERHIFTILIHVLMIVKMLCFFLLMICVLFSICTHIDALFGLLSNVVKRIPLLWDPFLGPL